MFMCNKNFCDLLKEGAWRTKVKILRESETKRKSLLRRVGGKERQVAYHIIIKVKDDKKPSSEGRADGILKI